jgi:hypothetical protein
MSDELLVLTTIERCGDTWLSADAIAARAGLPIGRVRAVLDTSPAVIVEAAPGGPGGPARYSTRAHYRATAGLMRRYVDALLTS